MNLFRVPKRAIWATALVAGMEPVKVRLFLNERARNHAGGERPSDLLNGDTDFIPGIDEAGRMMVLRRTSVLSLSVPSVEESAVSEEPFFEEPTDGLGDEGTGDDPDAGVTRIAMEVVFESGQSVRGQVAFAHPQSRRRLPDFLNDAAEFFPVHDGDTVHIVNKRRIARASAAAAG